MVQGCNNLSLTSGSGAVTGVDAERGKHSVSHLGQMESFFFFSLDPRTFIFRGWDKFMKAAATLVWSKEESAHTVRMLYILSLGLYLYENIA